jgi:predicted acylesterase/phospholipase RssA
MGATDPPPQTAAPPTGESTPDGRQSMRVCDVVMKGGITSGVVYPFAIVELAKRYFFKNIGGTSAGAIAATITAASEYRRRAAVHGVAVSAQIPPGFEVLARLPDWLAEDRNLFHLFQAGPGTRPLFNIGVAALGDQSPLARSLRLIATAAVNLRAATGIGVGVGLLLSRLIRGSREPSPAAMFGTVIVTGASTLVALGIGTVRKTLKALPENGYGLCNGLQRDPAAKAKPLTEWLADTLDAAAGITDPDEPLTFGMLWNARTIPIPEASIPNTSKLSSEIYAAETARASRQINLEMVTSCVTLGRPFRLPLEPSDRPRFFYRSDDLRKLFPERIVAWMDSHPRTDADPLDVELRRIAATQGIAPFPPAEHLPVVVAARMSLSFPVLLSAVPLLSVDTTVPQNAKALAEKRDRDVRFEPCWFSDGGLSSNFPIHFFDSPIPRWPTFALDLSGFAPGTEESQTDQRKNVWIPQTEDEGIAETWDRGPERSMAGFFSSMLNTMQNWINNTQMHLPGYRDRTVHIRLNEKEGGLNLTMPKSIIDKLTARGKSAGELFVAMFAGDRAPAWRHHRVQRYRTAMSLFEQWLRRYALGYKNPMPGDSSYSDLVGGGDASPTPSAIDWQQPTQAPFARRATQEVVQMSDRWQAGVGDETFTAGAPIPSPEFHTRPRI